ncbi:DUF1573 domain-containing protein, partial [Gemmatimonadota bacterium]
MGNSASEIFTIYNDGNAPLIVSYKLDKEESAHTLNPDYSEGEVEIAPGGSLEVSVSFTPTRLGSPNDSIYVYSNDQDEPLLKANICSYGKIPYVSIDGRIAFSYAAYGLNKTNIGAKSVVFGGNVGSNGDVILGVSSTVTSHNWVTEFPDYFPPWLVELLRKRGGIWAVEDCWLKSKAKVNGGVDVGGELRVDKESEITGTITNWVSPMLYSLDPLPSGSDYIDLKMKPNSELTLGSGFYWFNSIDIGTGCEVLIDQSDGLDITIVYVLEKMELHNKSKLKIVSEDASADQVFF